MAEYHDNQLPAPLPSTSARDEMRAYRINSRKAFTGKVITGSFGVIGIIFLVLVAVSIVRLCANQNIVTFTSFLQMLKGVPQISYDWISFTVTNFGDTFPWGLQWLGDIIDFFADFLGVALYSGTAIANIFGVLGYLLRWLFVM